MAAGSLFGIGSTLNAAHSRHRHHHHHHRNRAGSLVDAGSRAERMTYFGGQKAAELGVSVGLGAAQAYGEPLFFSDDPTKAWGLKLVVAIASNVAQLAQLWTGWSFARLFGPRVGVFADGAVGGTASSSFSCYSFDNSNTYFAAKIEAAGKGPGAAGEIDYAGRRQIHAPGGETRALGAGNPTPEQAATAARRAEFARRQAEAERVQAGLSEHPYFKFS